MSPPIQSHYDSTVDNQDKNIKLGDSYVPESGEAETKKVFLPSRMMSFSRFQSQVLRSFLRYRQTFRDASPKNRYGRYEMENHLYLCGWKWLKENIPPNFYSQSGRHTGTRQLFRSNE